MHTPLIGIGVAVSLLLQPAPTKTLKIAVKPTEFQSQVLLSEWKRKDWPLEHHRIYVDHNFQVEFVDWIQAEPAPKRYPAYQLSTGEWEYFETGDFAASGQAIQALRRVTQPWVEMRYKKSDYVGWLEREKAKRELERQKVEAAPGNNAAGHTDGDPEDEP